VRYGALAVSVPASPPLPEVLGEFTIRGVLGQGGSGIVYDATWGPRRVALKVLHPALVATARERAQFLAEARRLQDISHPGVVKVFAVGELPDDRGAGGAGGRPYLAMERLEGHTLAELLTSGALAVDRALGLFGQLCGAVAALHEQGLIHRDLKPENVFVVGDPAAGEHAVLLDFGIAKELAAPASTTTVDGGVRGTPAYMAPERFFGQPAGVATDVYELAVILYAMLAGRLPWDDLVDPEARLAPRALDGVAGVSAELDVELRRAMSTRAANRPSSARALLATITTAAGAPSAAVAGPGAQATAQLRVGQPPGAWFADRKPTTDRGQTPLAWAPTAAAPAAPAASRRRRWPSVIAVAALALGGGGAVLWRQRGAPDAAPVATAPRPTTTMLPTASDPWQAPIPVDGGVVGFHAALPLTTPAPAAGVFRAELVAALRHLPADTRVVLAVDIHSLRASPTIDRAIGAAAQDLRVSVLLAAGPPCLRELLGASDWLVYGAPSIDDATHGALILRGRWRRADVELCVGAASAGASPQPDGAKVMAIGDGGWLDFLDDHTAVLVTRNLDAASAHRLVTTTAGPTGRTAALLARLPAERAIAFAIDVPDDYVLKGLTVPPGSDLFGWLRPDDDGVALDVAAEPRTEAQAITAEGALKAALVDALGEHPNAAMGALEVVRDHASVHVRGRLSALILGMIESGLRGH
jgi:serine/threonine-protein kinase